MAAHKMFTMIDRVPDIDSENMAGQTLEKVTGTLELRNVRFNYPSRPKQTIFEDFNLVIPAGQIELWNTHLSSSQNLVCGGGRRQSLEFSTLHAHGKIYAIN